jgi:hypothetical protein
MGFMTGSIFVTVMRFTGESNSFIGEMPFSFFILVADGWSGGDEKSRVSHQNDALSPVLWQILNLRFQQSQVISPDNKAFMNFGISIDAKPSSQTIESIMSRPAIVGDEPVKIVLFQRPGKLPIRQDAFSDLENPGKNERGSITPGAYPDVMLHDGINACRINGGKIVYELFFLLCKAVDVPGKSWERQLEINHGLCSLCSMMVFNTMYLILGLIMILSILALAFGIFCT